MARQLQPKHKLCRRFGEKLCDSPKCPVVRRNYPPGQHGPKGKGRLSEYGRQLLEKQKAKALYGMLERQFIQTYERAVRLKGNSTDNMHRMLELRLDNVIYRMGFGFSRRQARQMVVHRHILVNHSTVNIPSYICKVGDEVTLKPKAIKVYELTKSAVERVIPSWLTVDKKLLHGKIDSMPSFEDQAQPLQMQLIIEFYSR